MSAPQAASIPAAVAGLMQRLADAGHAAHLVGRGAEALSSGRKALEFEIATGAAPGDLLALFPDAVVLDGSRRRLMANSSAGPVELLAYPDQLEDFLSRCDFSVHAIALDADANRVDPHGGCSDLAAGRLRCVGSADARLAEDPLRALRAARLVATRVLEPDADLLGALPGAAQGLAAQPAVRLRSELHRLLLGRNVENALELLRTAGLEKVLAPGVALDAPRVVGRLPHRLEIRLAGWLRGTRAVRTLRRLRVPRARVVAVERLLHLHPIDEIAHPSREAALRRLVRRSGEWLPDLLELREAELDVSDDPARENLVASLRELREAIDRVERTPAPSERTLALDGAAVMEILGCGPGPHVGRALSHLARCVEADPECNGREILEGLLRRWRDEN